MFKVVKEIKVEGHYGKRKTLHYYSERKARDRKVKKLGAGEVILSTIVDTNHKNGLEVHQLTSNGMVYIYNMESKKHITTLIARPQQVRRYFEGLGKSTPMYLISIASKHQKKQVNR